ncbi:MAG: RidA family protein, partial [Defluviitaleaceae bacterium]|nr:RidA family protein [Defluviitaleaceae bacterium]
YISGQVGIDPFSGEMAEGIFAQTRKTLENLRLTAEQAGSSLEKIVKVNIFVTTIDFWDDVNNIYREFFGEHKPARIIIPIGDLGDGLLIEIDAIAEV